MIHASSRPRSTSTKPAAHMQQSHLDKSRSPKAILWIPRREKTRIVSGTAFAYGVLEVERCTLSLSEHDQSLFCHGTESYCDRGGSTGRASANAPWMEVTFRVEGYSSISLVTRHHHSGSWPPSYHSGTWRDQCRSSAYMKRSTAGMHMHAQKAD